eukprot:gb/GECG01000283.1/.p1 GENE.gb/GECG01000283.1/~~gb/GECG01000283.1/.p1  ORF type:complete len:111 (+),score=5.82 gb/GECG01000283.1/:1-333(+)
MPCTNCTAHDKVLRSTVRVVPISAKALGTGRPSDTAMKLSDSTGVSRIQSHQKIFMNLDGQSNALQMNESRECQCMSVFITINVSSWRMSDVHRKATWSLRRETSLSHTV